MQLPRNMHREINHWHTCPLCVWIHSYKGVMEILFIFWGGVMPVTGGEPSISAPAATGALAYPASFCTLATYIIQEHQAATQIRSDSLSLRVTATLSSI